MQNILIVGSGDIARRLLFQWRQHPSPARIFALLRDASRRPAWGGAGARPLPGDLDDHRSLTRLAGIADIVVHLAPPPTSGSEDSRTKHLLAALDRGKSLPRCLIYVSTTGVYGDCAGALIDETRPPNPQSPRAARRVDAERQLREWGRRRGVRVCLLRAPGIYAADRLPLERLAAGLPVLCPDEDVQTNHIHADDLAGACRAAIRRGRANRCYNIVDESAMKMGDYFDLVADTFGYPRPPRATRQAVMAAVSPMQWSFMRESRRIDNRRLTVELQHRLAFPTVASGLADALARRK